jgi:hypothetical protein
MLGCAHRIAVISNTHAGNVCSIDAAYCCAGIGTCPDADTGALDALNNNVQDVSKVLKTE